ncbi:MAG: sigma factor-like helix-turn-helix DNA-binding protein [Erysipelotrichaceae bacterium]
MALSKEERKLILKLKIKTLRWDLITYNSVKAMIKAIDEEISRIELCSMDSAPPTDLIIGGKVTGAKATEFDSAVEAVSIRIVDFKVEKKRFENIVKHIDNSLSHLNEEDRRIIEMHFMEGKTLMMLAKEFNYEYEGVRSRIKRILTKVAKIY